MTTSFKKDLVIFDFDGTIIDRDSERAEIYLLPEEIYTSRLQKYQENPCNWIDFMNNIYSLMKEMNFTLKDMENALSQISLTIGIKELLEYLYQHKDKYETIIISNASTFNVEFLLDKYNIKNVFSQIYCNKSEIKNEMIYIHKNKEHQCKNCNPCRCKGENLKDFLQEYKRETFNRILFVCDGVNDFCLAKNLKINDYVFPRINFALWNILTGDQERKDKIKCGIVPFNSAIEIIDFLKQLN